MKSGVYRIINRLNGKEYIGSSVDTPARWKGHRRMLRSGQHHSRYLQRAWNKYGEAAFLFEVVEPCPPDQLLVVEQRWLDKVGPDYNISLVAGSVLGIKRGPLSSEHRRNVSMALKGHPSRIGVKDSPEARARSLRSISHLGRPLSAAHRAAISAGNRGKTHGPHTEAYKRNMSRLLKGRPSPTKGTVTSAETKQKLSAALKGRRFSEEHKAKIAAALRGKPKSAEQVAKMREVQLRLWAVRREQVHVDGE